MKWNCDGEVSKYLYSHQPQTLKSTDFWATFFDFPPMCAAVRAATLAVAEYQCIQRLESWSFDVRTPWLPLCKRTCAQTKTTKSLTNFSDTNSLGIVLSKTSANFRSSVRRLFQSLKPPIELGKSKQSYRKHFLKHNMLIHSSPTFLKIGGR